MNEFVYVVSLVGTNVHKSHSTQCVIKNIDNLHKVCAMIKKNHDIEFETL